MPTPKEIAAHFNRPVTINENGCWIWEGTIDHRGYGRYGQALVYGIVWRMAGRTVLQGQELRHKCLSKACINPDHLETGTHHQNMLDAVRDRTMQKGRKLTNQDITIIKQMLADGWPKYKIAEKMGISQQWFTRFQKGEFKYANPR